MATLITLGPNDKVKDSRSAINNNFDAINTELGGKSASDHGHKFADLTEDTDHKLVTDAERETWNEKADAHSHPYASDSHSHKASELTEDVNNRLVSDAEKLAWNKKADTKADVGLGKVENKSSATIRSEITDANINARVGASGNTIVKRHSSGYVFANYFNSTCNVQPSAPSYVMISNADNYIRKQTPAKLKAHMGIKSNADRNCTISTANPSGGSNGDVWYKY